MTHYLTKLFGKFSKNIGIDLGTCNTVIHVQGRGVLINEPSIIAIDKNTNSPIAIGEEAKLMLGRTPDSIEVIRPLKNGVIDNFDLTYLMLKHFLDKVQRISGIYPLSCIATPSNVTEVEKKAFKEIVFKAGAGDAISIEETHAAAIGEGISIEEPMGTFVCDIGGGTSEVGVISLGDIVLAKSIRLAGNSFDEDILNYIKKEYSLLIGINSAENIKKEIGSLSKLKDELIYEVKGRDLKNGLPKSIIIRSEEIREILQDSFKNIIKLIIDTLENTPPELSSDIMENGILITGGSANIKGIKEYFSKSLNIQIDVSNTPLLSVIKGVSETLSLANNDSNLYKKLKD